jgi:hypothetical protein
LVAQRLYALALGYEDVNDHTDLRRDPLLAVAANKAEPLGIYRGASEQGRALAAPATLPRLKTAVDHAGSRYHKLTAQPAAMRPLLLRQGVRTLAKTTRAVIVDFDATDARLHGQQEDRFFHGYYGFCFAKQKPILAPASARPLPSTSPICFLAQRHPCGCTGKAGRFGSVLCGRQLSPQSKPSCHPARRPAMNQSFRTLAARPFRATAPIIS